MFLKTANRLQRQRLQQMTLRSQQLQFATPVNKFANFYVESDHPYFQFKAVLQKMVCPVLGTVIIMVWAFNCAKLLMEMFAAIANICEMFYHCNSE